MRRLTTGIRSEKCVVRRFRRCANAMECTYTNLHIMAYYTPRLYGIGHKPVQHVTVLNTAGTIVSIITLYYSIIILWDHCRMCGPLLTETLLCGA